jgi:hypothetical protein
MKYQILSPYIPQQDKSCGKHSQGYYLTFLFSKKKKNCQRKVRFLPRSELYVVSSRATAQAASRRPLIVKVWVQSQASSFWICG